MVCRPVQQFGRWDLGQRVAWAWIVVNSAREVSTEVLEALAVMPLFLMSAEE